MANSFVAWRAQLIFALCLPIAVLLGYMLADPLDLTTMVTVVLVLGVLSIPLLMYAYHPLLIITWNAAIVPYFLPGQPYLWMLLAFMSLAIAVLNRFTSREAGFVSVPSVSRPLLVLLAVVLLTAYFRGGIGMRLFGSSQFGGRGYFYIVASITGYFALTSRRIEKHTAGVLVALFFLTGLTALIPNLTYTAGRSFYFLFSLFPADFAGEQAAFDFSPTALFDRLAGLTLASNGLYCWLLARYGLRGVFDLTRPVRLLLFVAAIAGCLFCGYRGFMVLFVLTVAVQFLAEKLYQPRVLIALGLASVFVLAIALPNIRRLPPVVQRTMAFLPVPVSPEIRVQTDASTEWRMRMWEDVILEVPAYLLAGKGYSIDPREVEMFRNEGTGGGRTWAVVTGAYHNGPLTLIIPFGIWGFAAFLWFAAASLKYLYRRYRYGDPDFHNINTFLFAYFVALLVYYLVAFGNFSTDFFHFIGIIALSISINGAESRMVEQTEESSEAVRDDELAIAGGPWK